MIHIFLILFLLFRLEISFANPYENSGLLTAQKFKKVILPIKKRVSFSVSQGAFGKNSHNEKGNEYSWDFKVPLNTKVTAVEDGKVIEVYSPNMGGKCDKSYSDFAHNVKVEHPDGTVAQYVHIDALVKKGTEVKKGDIIAKTAFNGWICSPHLHFSIYRSKKHLYNSKSRETLPLYFIGVPGGLLKQGIAIRQGEQ